MNMGPNPPIRGFRAMDRIHFDRARMNGAVGWMGGSAHSAWSWTFAGAFLLLVLFSWWLIQG